VHVKRIKAAAAKDKRGRKIEARPVGRNSAQSKSAPAYLFLVGSFTAPAAAASRFAFLVAVWACLALAFARATVVVSKLAFFAIPDILLEQGPVREYSFPRSSSSASARSGVRAGEEGRAGTEVTHRGYDLGGIVGSTSELPLWELPPCRRVWPVLGARIYRRDSPGNRLQ
jgi:hypothetical protein